MDTKHHLSQKYPLVVTSFRGELSYEEAIKCFATVHNYRQDRDLPMVYWITEAVDTWFSQLTATRVAEVTKQGMPGTVGDSAIIPLVVMDEEKYAYLLSELVNRYVWMDYPLFSSIDDAFYFMCCLLKSQDS